MLRHIRCLAGGRWHVVLHGALELTLQSLKLFVLSFTTQPSNEVVTCGSTCYINHIFCVATADTGCLIAAVSRLRLVLKQKLRDLDLLHLLDVADDFLFFQKTFLGFPSLSVSSLLLRTEVSVVVGDLCQLPRWRRLHSCIVAQRYHLNYLLLSIHSYCFSFLLLTIFHVFYPDLLGCLHSLLHLQL